MKIMIFADSWSALNNGTDSLIIDMLKEGYELICILPETEIYAEKLNHEAGLRFYFIPLRRRKHLPGRIKLLMYFIMTYTILKPDKIILHLNKKTISTGIVSRFFLNPSVSVIISNLDLLKCWKKIFYKGIYKSILKHCESVFFLYQDDYNLLARYKIEVKEKSLVLRGWGVDMNYYRKKSMPKTDLVYMSMPILCCQGVRCFIEIAKLVREKHPKVRFLLTGDFVEEPSILSARELDEACERGNIYYIEDIKDIRPYLEVCSIFVQPNVTVRQGHILEAEAAGRPILASDHPINRDMIIEGYNGFILPVKDVNKWADKILLLLENSKLKLNMADYSYELCSQRHDRRNINTLIIKKLKKLCKK